MKTRKTESVVYDWVSELPFQMQALLMTAMRGPDNTSKHNAAKGIVRFLRGAVLKPAGNTNMLSNDNDFMWWDYSVFELHMDAFWEDHDAYPHHFIMHLVHCAEVLAYCYPDPNIGAWWLMFYENACDSMHMHQETSKEMFKRLNDFGNIL